jgi:hypothetical protein
MKQLLVDAGHLVRVAVVFLIALLAFLAFRGLIVPRSFGQYGHYRGDALKEIASRVIVHAGQTACADCHEDVVTVKQTGKHAGLHCEGCHGPQARHVADPTAIKPPRPDTSVLCARCHDKNAARPPKFPQVNAKEHSGGMPCRDCHQPHSPALSGGGKG